MGKKMLITMYLIMSFVSLVYSMINLMDNFAPEGDGKVYVLNMCIAISSVLSIVSLIEKFNDKAGE